MKAFITALGLVLAAVNAAGAAVDTTPVPPMRPTYEVCYLNDHARVCVEAGVDGVPYCNPSEHLYAFYNGEAWECTLYDEDHGE
jgi:hypothetical protein